LDRGDQPINDDAKVIFFNACDLGFGRSMHMKTSVVNGKNNYAFCVYYHGSAEDARNTKDLIAIAAVEQWQFEPPTRQGKPVIVCANQEFSFVPGK